MTDLDVTLRPMTYDDVDAVRAVVKAADDAAYPPQDGEEPETPTEAQNQRAIAGTRRFIDRDPEGTWVAEGADGVVAMAEAIRRDDFWGLSMLFAHPRAQGQGVGRQLMAKVMDYADGSRVRMIMTSEDPRALRRYSAAGLAIHPAVQMEGKADPKAIPSDLPGREGSADDVDFVADVDKTLDRNRREDVEFLLTQGFTMEIVDDGAHRGFGLHLDGRMTMLGATDDQTATTLLWRMFAASGDKKISGYCLTAGQDWAVKVALAARLSVKPGGPLFVAGMQPPGPWIPSGWYF